MTFKLPKKTREYRNHSIDSSHWQHYSPRNDDIVIVTSIKAGTTWMQNIVGSLIFQDKEMPGPLYSLTMWIDFRLFDKEDMDLVENQNYRRFNKSHLPLDGLPFFPQIKYIYVGRHALDILMSLFNHHQNHKPKLIEALNHEANLIGDPWPGTYSDIHDFYSEWISKGSFPWEKDGYPYWSVFHHLQSWWNFKYLDNILFVHFNDLLNNLEGEMKRVAKFLGIQVLEEAWDDLVKRCSFSHMKQNAEEYAPGGTGPMVGGADAFFHKGTNGRWRGVLTEVELQLYKEKVSTELTEDCKNWMENGGIVTRS